jgi:hypothetical protein
MWATCVKRVLNVRDFRILHRVHTPANIYYHVIVYSCAFQKSPSAPNRWISSVQSGRNHEPVRW